MANFVRIQNEIISKDTIERIYKDLSINDDFMVVVCFKDGGYKNYFYENFEDINKTFEDLSITLTQD